MTSDESPVAGGSGDRAVAAAAERAKVTAARNIPVFSDLPAPADTANLREGADLNDALLALLPLVGVWRGEGEGRGAQGDYRFGQQIVVSHDGGDYLIWEARSWRLTESGDYEDRGLRESGFWRFVDDPNDPAESQAIELLLAHSAGYVELFYGQPAQPVVVGTGHRCVGAQQVRDARRWRETVVRHCRGGRFGLRRGAR